MKRGPEDLARAAHASGAKLLSTELVQLKDGSWELAGRFGFTDPWAAARLLCILAEEDGVDPDPEVAAWSASILSLTAKSMGLSPSDPAVHDAFVAAVHANVQKWIRFAPEEGERFQSARTTMIEGVGDCDCHARLVHALARASGARSEIRFFEADREPVHAVAALGTSYGPAWAETTIGALFGEHPQEAYARLGLDRAGARPDIGAGAAPTHDDVVALQTRLKDLALATGLAVEACPALPPAQVANWATLAGIILHYVSTDPDAADYATGMQLGQELQVVGDELRAAGCQAPIPAPLPKNAPAPPSNNPFEGLGKALAEPLKVVAVVVGVVAGAIVVVKVADAMKSRSAA